MANDEDLHGRQVAAAIAAAGWLAGSRARFTMPLSVPAQSGNDRPDRRSHAPTDRCFEGSNARSQVIVASFGCRQLIAQFADQARRNFTIRRGRILHEFFLHLAEREDSQHPNG
jgi:hypothetical protein